MLVAFPAYAGMNRKPPRRKMTTFRVPRVCGDEPYEDLIMEGMKEAFPAYAGMNRDTKYIYDAGAGVPRACGDEPWEATPEPLRDLRSPRMQG